MSGQTFQYRKLHGSTNWHWDETTRAADSIVDIGLEHVWRESEPRYPPDEHESRAPGKVPMIVPPMTSKSGYFDNPVIRDLWRGAFEALRGARRVFVIGYSMPPGDSLVRSMMNDAIQPGQEFWIVNPSGTVAD